MRGLTDDEIEQQRKDGLDSAIRHLLLSEEGKRRICRAAAEITKLTHWDIEQAATAWEDKFLAMLPEQRKSETAAKLRHFAELAKEEE